MKITGNYTGEIIDDKYYQFYVTRYTLERFLRRNRVQVIVDKRDIDLLEPYPDGWYAHGNVSGFLSGITIMRYTDHDGIDIPKTSLLNRIEARYKTTTDTKIHWLNYYANWYTCDYRIHSITETKNVTWLNLNPFKDKKDPLHDNNYDL